nr:pentatricopeptide repeat-containing protein At1g08070, chloroplastic [Ipomoea batatas]
MVFDKSSYRYAVPFTSLVCGYVLGGFFDDARKLFDEIPVRDVVCWNAMISGYDQVGRYKEALALFEEMKRENVTHDVSNLAHWFMMIQLSEVKSGQKCWIISL